MINQTKSCVIVVADDLTHQRVDLLIVDNTMPDRPHGNRFKVLVLTSPKPDAVNQFSKPGMVERLFLPSLSSCEHESMYYTLHESNPEVGGRVDRVA